jgi:hypothetical protein
MLIDAAVMFTRKNAELETEIGGGWRILSFRGLLTFPATWVLNPSLRRGGFQRKPALSNVEGSG